VKPTTQEGYKPQRTLDCERVLVTLIRGLGPWGASVCLVGGLTPRYLVTAKPPSVPAHAGTLDVDVVVAVVILADTDAYHTLEENLMRMGFKPAKDTKGRTLRWRWITYTKDGAEMILEFLAEQTGATGGSVQPLPTDGNITALNIEHASIVFDLYDEVEITAELLGENGVTTVKVKHANLVSFTCLKVFAFTQRGERKDAHDLIYCLEYAAGGMDEVADMFKQALSGKHGAVIRSALESVRKHFADDSKTEGYRKDGPVAVARFELGEEENAETRESRALRQRQVNNVINRLLENLDAYSYPNPI
jgi:hypothetical protein